MGNRHSGVLPKEEKKQNEWDLLNSKLESANKGLREERKALNASYARRDELNDGLRDLLSREEDERFKRIEGGLEESKRLLQKIQEVENAIARPGQRFKDPGHFPVSKPQPDHPSPQATEKPLSFGKKMALTAATTSVVALVLGIIHPFSSFALPLYLSLYLLISVVTAAVTFTAAGQAHNMMSPAKMKF